LYDSGVRVSEEQLLAIAERAQLIADRSYESRMLVRHRIEKSMERIEASFALLARVKALRL
jgi:hypothetical protein